MDVALGGWPFRPGSYPSSLRYPRLSDLKKMRRGGEEGKQRNSRMTNEEKIPRDEIRVKGVSLRTQDGAQIFYPPRARHCLTSSGV